VGEGVVGAGGEGDLMDFGVVEVVVVVVVDDDDGEGVAGGVDLGVRGADDGAEPG